MTNKRRTILAIIAVSSASIFTVGCTNENTLVIELSRKPLGLPGGWKAHFLWTFLALIFYILVKYVII